MALDFGVEIECLFPGRATGFTSNQLAPRGATGIAQDLIDAGVACSFVGYNHHRSEMWKIVTDQSVSAPPGYVALELVSPPLTDTGLVQVEKVCEVITRLGAKTNRTCGLHVHIGARELSIDAMRRLAYLYIEHEDVIDSLLPPSRRANNNSYCRSLKQNVIMPRLEAARSIEDIAKALARSGMGSYEKPSRYTKLNFAAFFRHGTVEFRQHSGTVDAIKIINWVKLCQKMVDIAGMEVASVAPVVNNTQADAALARRIARARQLRLIYEAVARPEGATSAEVQALLGRRTPPALSSDLTRLNVPFRTDGRRGGHVVYKLMASAASAATLASMLNKLGLEESEAEFWRQRRALLGSIGVSADLAE
jgi:hypothetical protein